MISRDEVERMDRSQRIAEEVRRAEQVGLRPTRWSMNENFRMETSTRLDPGGHAPTEAEIASNDNDVLVVSTRPDLFPVELASLAAPVDAEVAGIEAAVVAADEAGVGVPEHVVEQLRNAQIRSTNRSAQFGALQEKISHALFGEIGADLPGEFGGATAPSGTPAHEREAR